MKKALVTCLAIAGAKALLDVGGYIGEGVALANMEAIKKRSTLKYRALLIRRHQTDTSLKEKWQYFWIKEGYNAGKHLHEEKVDVDS